MQQEQCHRNPKAISRAQNFDKSLDFNYNPHDQEDIDIFDDQKKLALSVFERALLTDQEKYTVRSHETGCETQLVYKDFYNYHAKSAKASLTTSYQTSYLSISRIDEWKGLDELFILHLQYKLRTCEDAVPHTDKRLENMKNIMLENYATSRSRLKQVKDMDDQLKMHS